MPDSIHSYPLRVPGVAGSGQFQDVVSPYSGEVIATVEQADADAVEAAMQLAAHTFDRERATMPPHRRAAILEDLAAQMKSSPR